MASRGLNIGFNKRPWQVIASPGRFGYNGGITKLGETQVLGPGFLDAGHYLARIQPLVAVFPRPDSETSANARHHYAFYDGVHPMLYDVPFDVIGGAYPHFPVLIAGPGITGTSGVGTMEIVLPSYTSGPPYPSPRLQWTPLGNWSGTVTVRCYSQEYQTDSSQYIDISFTLSTSSDISNGGQFIFINKDIGSSSNSGSWASPLDDLPTAYGTTYAAVPTVGGIATGGKICVLQSATATYVEPIFSDGPLPGTFCQHVTRKPTAFIGNPSSTKPKITLTGGITTSGNADDLYMSWLNTDGFNPAALNFRHCLVSGIADSRITMDSVTWTNSGWGLSAQVTGSVSGSVLTVTAVNNGSPLLLNASVGTSIDGTIPYIQSFGTGTGGVGTYNLNTTASISAGSTIYVYGGDDNPSILTTSHNNSGFRQYIYANNLAEPNRPAGITGNNFGGPDFYSCQYSLIQGYTMNNPSWVGDSGCFIKVDNENCEIRGCFYNITSCGYPCSFGEATNAGFTLCDIIYNTIIASSKVGIGVPQLNSGAIATGTLRLARNTIITPAGTGVFSNQPNTGGPYLIDYNALQGPSVSLPSGTSIATPVGNQLAASGLLNATTGLLIGTTYLGTTGAQIA